MLEAGKCYRDNDHDKVRIGGRVREYSEAAPWVWSVGGDWYHEGTGQFVLFRRPTATDPGAHYLADRDHRRSIGDHREVDFGTGELVET